MFKILNLVGIGSIIFLKNWIGSLDLLLLYVLYINYLLILFFNEIIPFIKLK